MRSPVPVCFGLVQVKKCYSYFTSKEPKRAYFYSNQFTLLHLVNGLLFFFFGKAYSFLSLGGGGDLLVNYTSVPSRVFDVVNGPGLMCDVSTANG